MLFLLSFFMIFLSFDFSISLFPYFYDVNFIWFCYYNYFLSCECLPRNLVSLFTYFSFLPLFLLQLIKVSIYYFSVATDFSVFWILLSLFSFLHCSQCVVIFMLYLLFSVVNGLDIFWFFCFIVLGIWRFPLYLSFEWFLYYPLSLLSCFNSSAICVLWYFLCHWFLLIDWFFPYMISPYATFFCIHKCVVVLLMSLIYP